MSDENIIPFPRHGAEGFYSIGELPQAPSLEGCTFDTGWSELDGILKFYHGQFVVVTGFPGHGKSTFLFNVIVNIARKEGIKSFLYVPENERFLITKLQKIWGERDGFDHFAYEQCFIQSADYKFYTDAAHTLPWILDRAAFAIERDHIEFVMIDPWNEIERAKPKDQLLTDYVGECLRLLKQFARHFDVVVCMVAHPTKQAGEVPTLFDIEGSMNWANKSDNGLIVVREEANTARVISAKVRECPIAGSTGMRRFYVDPQTGIFTPLVGPAGDQYDPTPRKSYRDRR